MRVLVVGGSGMLGHMVYRSAAALGIDATATLRNSSARKYFPDALQRGLIDGVDALDIDALLRVMSTVRPDLVVNCAGLVKQLGAAKDPLTALPINAIFPHRLARLCSAVGSRLVHISTDCVFSGSRGGYTEKDFPDAADLYGRSKLLGEVDAPDAITLRTSIIGHELGTKQGLLEWFLGEQGAVRGFRRAVFSGLTTNELARVILDVVARNSKLHGVFQVSSEAINKHDLLSLIRTTYQRDIEIVPDDSLVIDRSLDSTKFREMTGYQPPAWPIMVEHMHSKAP